MTLRAPQLMRPDYIRFLVTAVPRGIKDCPRLVRRLFPYAIIITSFMSFVVINGGVVLGKTVHYRKYSLLTSTGDKSNHVASIHLPQMLYIWPFITFFSWPALLPRLIHCIVCLFSEHRRFYRSPWSASLLLFRPSVLLFITLGLFAVHFNTVVHPFTLADNRHYNFYVFRILRRHYLIKYLVVSIYIFCGWACISALGRVPQPDVPKERAQSEPSERLEESSKEPREPAVQVSWVVIWLTVCTLCLATAPLVEPRYLILPWMMWRIRVPLAPSSLTLAELLSQKKAGRRGEEPKNNSVLELLGGLCVRWAVLSLELAWVILVNVVTGYMFLRRGFEWVDIDEEAGSVQRFMW